MGDAKEAGCKLNTNSMEASSSPSVGSDDIRRKEKTDQGQSEKDGMSREGYSNVQPEDGDKTLGWTYVRSSIKPEMALSPPYVIAAHANLKDVMLFHAGSDKSLFDRCILVRKHEKEVTSLAVMPDNVQFLTGGNDKMIYSWSVASENGRMVAKCTGEIRMDSAVRMLSPHPRDNRVAIVLSGNVILLRHLSRNDVDEMQIQIKDCNVTAVCQGQRTLVYGTDSGLVYVWQYENSDNLVAFYRASSAPVHFLSLRDETIASWGRRDDYIRIWDTASRKSAATLCTETDQLELFAQSPDGSHVIMTKPDTNDVFVYQSRADGFGRIGNEHELCFLAADNCEAYFVSAGGRLFRRDYRQVATNKIRSGCGERLTNTDAIKAEVTSVDVSPEDGRKASAVCVIL